MNIKAIQIELAQLIKEAAKTQIRLHSWTVTTSEDRDAVRQDIDAIVYKMDKLKELVGL